MKQLELAGSSHHLTLYKLLSEHNPNHIVIERFVYQRRDKVELVPVEYIGIVRLFSLAYDRPIFEQSPAQAKNLWTDEKLKTLGYYRKGMPHANDAVRHMLYYYTVTRKNMRWVHMLREEMSA